jgi:adenylate cyclase
MPEKQKVTRKLSAILSADVKGYSVLMADDEVHTIETLKAYRQIISDLVSKHSGRVVDSPGDNILAEFRSSVDAVECSVQIQKKLEQENSKHVDDKKVQFRIGVNVGDVIQDGDRIYGNGVNVAARIEGLAEPAGVCISRNAYDHIKNKLTLGYEYIGEHSVKNIKDPVRVYKLLMADEDAGKLIGEKTKPKATNWIILMTLVSIVAFTIFGYQIFHKLLAPEKEATTIGNDNPTIAILPFDNMTGDSKQDYLCDGITEHIISTLSYVPNLMVIARNSSFAYKGKPLNIQQIGKELNADWVIEGSIQLSNERIRITVQLIDAASGHHKWSETYDRELNELFKLQDEISLAILESIQIKLAMGESVRNLFDGINTYEEYKKALKIWSYFNSTTYDSMNLAQQELLELININPDISFAYTALSYSYVMDIWHNQCESIAICIGEATENVNKAISLNDKHDWALMTSGIIFLMKGDYEKAITQLNKAIIINPSNAWAYDFLGYIQIHTDRFDEAIANLEKAIRLNPIPPADYFFNLGFAYMFKKNFTEAIKFYHKSLEINPDFWSPLAGLACAYGHLGNIDKTKSTISELHRVFPGFDASNVVNVSPFKNEATRDFFREGFQKAGLIK